MPTRTIHRQTDDRTVISTTYTDEEWQDHKRKNREWNKKFFLIGGIFFVLAVVLLSLNQIGGWVSDITTPCLNSQLPEQVRPSFASVCVVKIEPDGASCFKVLAKNGGYGNYCKA